MNIFFSGIGGVGIGPLAEIALDAGYTITGSDLHESPLTTHLRRRGVIIDSSQDGTFLNLAHKTQPIDWFVYTSALPDDHPELRLARSLGIKTAKRDELLAHIIREKNLKLIAVTGTHGKTTTTGMLIWAFKQLGIPASYSIGTTLSFGVSGALVPGSEYFIYECDEFDRNFLHFSPYLSLITSVGYDHSDTYPTKRDYLEAFNQFIYHSEHVIMWQTDNHGFHIEPEKAWILQPNDISAVAQAGAHNRRNASLVIKALKYLTIADNTRALEILTSFPGTNRRFEKLADNLYSDHGHHPVEIAATLQLAREVSDQVVLVYQPHQNIRQHEIKDEYKESFKDADAVYWLPTYLTRENPELPILTPAELISHVSNSQIIHTADMNQELWQIITEARQGGKLVLCMGAGTIDSWVRGQIEATEQAASP